MASKRPWTEAEDTILKERARFQSCKRIGQALARSHSSVHARAKRLGISMIKRGEAHWRAKATSEIAAMIGALGDAGFKGVQIHALVTQSLDLSREAVDDIIAARTWR